MKKLICIMLVCLLFLSGLPELNAVKASGNLTSIITYDTTTFTNVADEWGTSTLESNSDFEMQHSIQLNSGATLWQPLRFTDELSSPQVGDTVHAEVTFITHSNITNTNNVLIRVVGSDQHLVEISSIDDAITGQQTTLQASPKDNNGIIPAGTDTLWVELHNDTDGTLEIQSIRLWGERSNDTILYDVPNAYFTEPFTGNWEYAGVINVNSSIYMNQGVAAWRPLALSSNGNSPLQGDIVEAQVSLFISDTVTTNDHVYLRLNDGANTLIDINNITNLPRNQWITVSGQVMQNGAQISSSASELWVTIYNDSNSSIRMKDFHIQGTRSNINIYDLNEDGYINEQDLALLQQAYEQDNYEARFDFDKDDQLTEKDILFFKKFPLQQSHLFYLNLEHFLFMNEQVEIEDIPMLITHLYSEPIDRNNLSLGYKWVGDPQEGFAAVDDVSRSVTAFVEHYRLYGDSTSYENIKLGLEFLMWMQYSDGDYDNFVVRHQDGTIEKKDSYSSSKSYTWWALRAYGAIAEAYSILNNSDDELKDRLEASLALNLQRLTELTTPQYGETFTIGDKSYAKWMLGGDAWLTAGVINSLYAHHKVADQATQAQIKVITHQLGEALAMTQAGSFTQFPYGGFMHIIDGSQKSINWNEWGSISIRAMAYAGVLTDNEQWINSAVYAAESFIGDLMISGRAETISPNKKPYPLINYGTSSNVDNMLALYEITQDTKYAKLAGLIGSWWTGNNVMNTPMFNQETGYAYDGMTATEVNINSGGESLAEAIRTLARLMSLPEAEQYLYATTGETFGAQTIEIEQLFKNSSPPDAQKNLPNGMLNSPEQAIVAQNSQSGSNEQLIYADAQGITQLTELYPNWYGKQTIFVAADGYNNMRLFDQGELLTTIAIGNEEGQFQHGDYVKLDFAARVEFDTDLIAEVFAVNSEQEETLIASSENMSYHARTWYSGVNSVKTTPLAPIPEDATELLVRFNVNSTKTLRYEGFAMVTEAKIYTMGVTEVRYGNTELSNSSYVELYPNITRSFNIEVPKNATYDVVLSYVHQNQASFNITVDQQSINTISLNNGMNGNVVVQKVGRMNLTEGEHQLTLSNVSSATSVYLDAITLYPVTSYASYTLASNEVISVVRDATNEQLLWVEGIPTIAPITDTPIPTPKPSSAPVSNQPGVFTPSNPAYWTLQGQSLITQEGVTSVLIPENKTQLLLTIEDLKSIQQLRLLSTQFNITFDETQLQKLMSQLTPNTRIVLTIEQLTDPLATPTATPIIYVDAVTIDNNGKTIVTLPISALLTFTGITDDNGLGLYMLQDRTAFFYGIGQLHHNQWQVRIQNGGQYVGLTYHKSYDDASNTHWANQAIAALTSWHIVKGQSEKHFGVQNNLTQAELLTMLVRIHNLNTGSNVANSKNLPWYQPYVDQANKQALISLDNFSPNQVMTRQQVVAWLVEFINRNELEIKPNSISLDQYQDVSTLSPESIAAWSTLIQLGIIQGDHQKMLHPNKQITRAEIVIILYRLLQIIPN
ncbi:S-layer homology domain-containing protein [Paenibacillus sp. CMAA1364]